MISRRNLFLTALMVPALAALPARAADIVTPGSFTATGQSPSFSPTNTRAFNISIQGTFVGTVQLERFLNGVWQPVTVAAGSTITQMAVWSAKASDQWFEPVANVLYRLNCTAYTSGTINYAVGQ